MPASDRYSSVFQVSASPAPSQPTGGLPDAFFSRSRVRWMDARSSSGAISLMRSALVSLWPISSQPASSMASITSGWWSQTWLLVAAVARMP
jgi:hypothetical protein